MVSISTATTPGVGYLERAMNALAKIGIKFPSVPQSLTLPPKNVSLAVR